MPVTKGSAFVSTSFLTGKRFFHFGTRTNGGQSASDQPIWQLEAGEPIELRFWTGTAGLLPPPEPGIVFLDVYYETGNATLVRRVWNSGLPSNGARFTFWATDDGTETGEPRCGTLRLSIHAQFGTLYLVRSDGTGSGLDAWSQGLLRANAKVSAITHDGYPNGDRYALGVVDDESVTLRAAITPPFDVRGHELLAWRILHDQVDIHTDPSHFPDSAGQLSVSLPTDSVFLDALETYGAGLAVDGNSELEPSSGAVAWTSISADNANLVDDADGVSDPALFDVDPRVQFADVTAGSPIYNRGQTASIEIGLINARGEPLLRDLDLALVDSLNQTQSTQTLSGPIYEMTYPLPVDADARNDQTGAEWRVKLVDPTVTATGDHAAFYVSSLLNIYVHAQLHDNLVLPSSWPPISPSPAQEFKIGTDQIFLWVHSAGVGSSHPPIETTGDAISVSLYDPAMQLSEARVTDSQAGPTNQNLVGWSPRLQFTPQLPEGEWQFVVSVSHEGNSGSANLTAQYLLIVDRDLFVLLAPPVDARPGETARILLLCERNGAAVEADTIPQWRLISTDADVPAMEELSSGAMTFCGTQADPLYCVDLTMPLDEGRYLIGAHARLSGQLVGVAEPFEVKAQQTITHPLSFRLGPFSVPLTGESYVD